MHTLLQKETLDEDEEYTAAGVSRDTAPAAVARSKGGLTTAESAASAGTGS